MLANRPLPKMPSCVLAVLTPAIALAACAGAPHPAAAPAIVDISAAETRVALRPGQELVVRLRSNPSTGYSWTIGARATGVLVSAGPPAFEPDPKSAGRVGAGGVEAFRFTAAAAGREALRFEYRRPWEKDAAPASTAIVDVDVRAGGS